MRHDWAALYADYERVDNMWGESIKRAERMLDDERKFNQEMNRLSKEREGIVSQLAACFAAAGIKW